MRKPKTILSEWLYNALRGMYTSGVTLYVGRLEAEMANLTLPGEVRDNVLVLTGEIISGNNTFPICTKEEVKTPFFTYDSIEVTYGGTKDGRYPETITARVVCVHSTYTDAEALCDDVEARIHGSYIPGLGILEVQARRSAYEQATGEFFEELKINVEL